MPTKKLHQTIPCDSVLAIRYDTDFNIWTVSRILPVWHELAHPVDLYHVKKSDIRAMRDAKRIPFTKLFDTYTFCVMDEDEVLHVLTPHQYNPDDVAFIILLDAEPPEIDQSPSA